MWLGAARSRELGCDVCKGRASLVSDLACQNSAAKAMDDAWPRLVPQSPAFARVFLRTSHFFVT